MRVSTNAARALDTGRRATRGHLDTVVAPGRYVRLCRTHRKPLVETPQGLACPGDQGLGAHTATRWLVHDREKGIVLVEANDARGPGSTVNDGAELVVQELHAPLREIPHRGLSENDRPLPLRDAREVAELAAIQAQARELPASDKRTAAAPAQPAPPLERPREEVRMPRGRRKAVEGEAAGDEQAKGKPRGPGRPKGGDIKATKLRDGDAVLALRLERAAVGGDDTRFRVWWEVRQGKSVQRGCAGGRASEALGLELYDRELARAREAGWADMYISSGRGRPIEIRSVPAAPSRAE